MVEIDLEDEHTVPNVFFQKLEDSYEKIKVEVREKEVISKEDIQEFLVKPSMEYSHYIAFLHKFVKAWNNTRSATYPLMWRNIISSTLEKRRS